VKRFGLLLFALFIGSMVAYGLSYKKVRPEGTATPSSGTYYLVCDSTDTFQVDTIYSDTVDLENYGYLNYYLEMTGFAMADSANDSAVVIVQGHASYEGKMDTVLTFDTFPQTLGTLDSTDYAMGVLKIDTLPYDRFYFATIVKDSFVLGAGRDSSEFRMHYQTIQTEPTSR